MVADYVFLSSLQWDHFKTLKKNKRLFFTYLERVDELLLEYREDIFWR